MRNREGEEEGCNPVTFANRVSKLLKKMEMVFRSLYITLYKGTKFAPLHGVRQGSGYGSFWDDDVGN